MEEGIQTSMVNHANVQNDIVVFVKHEPVMQTAVDLLQSFTKDKRIVLKAKGNAIPNAVAVANILTENMLKNNTRTEKITVDSEIPPEMGRMISTIEIILVRI